MDQFGVGFLCVFVSRIKSTKLPRRKILGDKHKVNESDKGNIGNSVKEKSEVMNYCYMKQNTSDKKVLVEEGKKEL